LDPQARIDYSNKNAFYRAQISIERFFSEMKTSNFTKTVHGSDLGLKQRLWF
jgi:hypothetical protein